MTTFGYGIDTRALFFFLFFSCVELEFEWVPFRKDIDRIRFALEAMLTYFVACDRGTADKILLFIGFIIGFYKIQLIRRRKTP